MNALLTPALPENGLVAAYQATDFIVRANGTITLRVDVPVQGLTNWLKDQDARSAVVITAYSPFSRPTSDDENTRMQDELRKAVSDAGLSWGDASGAARDGAWPEEPSECVFDAPEELIDAWLERFKQYAVVSATLDGKCKLVWHPAIRAQMAMRDAS